MMSVSASPMASPVPSSFSQGFELPRPDPADFPPEIIPTIGNIEIPLDKRFPTAEFDQLPECSQLLEQAFTAQNFKAYRLTHPGGMDTSKLTGSHTQAGWTNKHKSNVATKFSSPED